VVDCSPPDGEVSTSDLFKREVLEVSTFPGMLDGKGADVPFTINVELGVLVQVLRLHDVAGPQLDVEGIGVLEDLTFMARRTPRISRGVPCAPSAECACWAGPTCAPRTSA
jgi:hypothetical protein